MCKLVFRNQKFGKMKVCAGIDLFSFSIEVVWKMVFENVGEP